MKEFKNKKRIDNLSILTFDQLYKLIKYEIKTTEDLISAYNNTEENLDLIKNIFETEAYFQNVVNQAKLMRIHGINKLSIKLLNLCEIYTLNQLSKQDAKELNLKLIEINRKYSIAKIDRSDYIIYNWITQAQELVKKENENV